MRWPNVLVALLLGGALAGAEKEAARTFTFARADAGKLPKGWTAARTGKGEGSVWKVVADPTAPSKAGYVLAQTAEGPDRLFNLCVADDTSYTDLEARVSFKAIRGKEDQGGGLVWRYQDADNYYICRMNPLEDNFRVYKVVGGKRTMLATTKDDVKVPAGGWHTITVRMEGESIDCFLDGKKLLSARDTTFNKAGKVGLWSKADAQTYFDGLTITGK